MNNFSTILRIVTGIIFIIVSIKYFSENDYMFGGLFLVVGIVYIIKVFTNRKG